ncbi:MAG: hypothetical protein JXR52_06095 [Bacteroidales bacterium]|nr:hypothetical protein [Bacteroidales bacterium]MBN2698378.1 hypothetical protein [Bacteroidales bacterium]
MNNKEQNSYNFSSVDLLIYIWKKRVILVIVGLIAGIASIIASLLITPMYKASVVMFPVTDATISKSLLAANYQGRQGVYGFGEEEQAEQLLQVLNSVPIRERIIETYDLMEHYEIDSASKYPQTELIETYRSNINFKLTEFMSVEISVMDKDPQYAADIANDISDLVDTVYSNMKKQRSIRAFKLVEEEYLDAEANLKMLQDSVYKLTAHLKFKEGSQSGEDLILELVKTDPENGATYISLINKMQHIIPRVAEMRLRYQEARLETEQDLPYKFIVERAFPPEKKAYPNKSLIVIVSTFSSLLLALIVLIVIDNIRKRISSEAVS